MSIVLPVKKVAAETQDPKNLIIYGAPKVEACPEQQKYCSQEFDKNGEDLDIYIECAEYIKYNHTIKETSTKFKIDYQILKRKLIYYDLIKPKKVILIKQK